MLTQRKKKKTTTEEIFLDGTEYEQRARAFLFSISAQSYDKETSQNGSPFCYRPIGTIDYRIKELETVRITGFIRISRFRKLCTLARALM